jgi:hypothetical protein
MRSAQAASMPARAARHARSKPKAKSIDGAEHSATLNAVMAGMRIGGRSTNLMAQLGPQVRPDLRHGRMSAGGRRALR